jgi:hypothetical protein
MVIQKLKQFFTLKEDMSQLGPTWMVQSLNWPVCKSSSRLLFVSIRRLPSSMLPAFEFIAIGSVAEKRTNQL